MRKLLFLLLTVLSGALNAQTLMTSPDGKMAVTFEINNGHPMYSVAYDDLQMMDLSPLGIVANCGDFTKEMTLLRTENSHLEGDYTLDRSKTGNVHFNQNEYKQILRNGNNQEITITFRISNNDIAFRYEMPIWDDKTNGKKRSVRVMREATGFDFPHNTTTFLCPQSEAMTGWKSTKPSYEEEYLFDEPMTTHSKYGQGYTFPCLFHINSTADSRREGWVMVSETDVDSRYCGSRLSDMKGDGLYTLEFPMPEENNGNGTIEPALSLPNATPWRTITVGTSLKPIVETTVAWDNVEPRYTTTNKYVYGKGTWSWIVWQDGSINYEDQQEYIRLAKAMNFQYVLIDNWWDTNIGCERMEHLIEYAHSQGIDVFLWYSSSGWWNDIEQGPINIMGNSIKRKEYMRWMQKMGVKGIKVDFFGGDKQETMRLYEQILSDADDHGLMVIFHGCTLPRGWERMYPNYVGSEAVLASENLIFEQHFCDVEAQNTALHPFLRNTVGCMEWGGCFMNRHLRKGNKGGNTRRTTDCHELATTILFQNPIQNFAIAPENIGVNVIESDDYNAEGVAAPKLCMDFLREVPTTWDETRFIEGYPGKYVVLARRHGDTWYIAGNNAYDYPLTISISLDEFTSDNTVTLFCDNAKTREAEKKEMKLKGKPLRVTIAKQGGFVITAKAK